MSTQSTRVTTPPSKRRKNSSPRSYGRSLSETAPPSRRLSPIRPAFLTTIAEGDGESVISSAVDDDTVSVDNPEDDEVDTIKNNGLKRWWHVMGTGKNYAESDSGSKAASSTIGLLEAQSASSNVGSDVEPADTSLASLHLNPKKQALNKERTPKKDDFADDITADTSVNGRKKSPDESGSTSKVASGTGKRRNDGLMKTRLCVLLLVMFFIVALASIGIFFYVNQNRKSSGYYGGGKVSKNNVGDGIESLDTDGAPTLTSSTVSPTSAPVFDRPENIGDENGSSDIINTETPTSTPTTLPTPTTELFTAEATESSTTSPAHIATVTPTVNPSASPTSSPTPSPASKLTSSPTTETLAVLVRTAAIDTLQSISETDVTQLDDTDPRFQAAVWLMETDKANLKVELNPPDKQQISGEIVSQDRYAQRYILAVTYFSLNGEGWAERSDDLVIRQRRIKYEGKKMPEKAKPKRRILADSSKKPFLSKTHECNWDFIVCEKIVLGTDDDGNKIHANVVTGIVIPGADNDGENPVPGRDVRGQLPGKELGKLKYLKEITMNHNNLSGPIPTELTLLEDLYWVDLTGNSLTGYIPQFGLNLQYLYLGGNKFKGNLPAFDDTGDYQLLHLWVHDNDLTGNIPDTLGSNLKELTMLLLYGNELSSVLPETMNMLSSLTWLDVAYNQLSGYLPDGFYDAIYLQNAYLNHNGFYGEVKPKVKNLLQLEELWIDNNSFSGDIPNAFRFLYKLGSLQLHNNFFTGEVPLGICQHLRSPGNVTLSDITVNCDEDKHVQLVDYVECACCEASECK